MSRHPILWLVIVLAALTGAAQLGLFPVSRVSEVAIYVMYAAGVVLLASYTGLVPFGASVFFGFAAYAAAIFSTRVMAGEFIGIGVAMVLSAVLALVLGLLILRRQGLYFSLLTLAASQIAFEIAFKWTSFTGGENGLQGVPRGLFESELSFHLLAVASAVVCLWFMWRLVHSPFGRTLQAVRDNEQRASSVGYDPYWYRLAAFIAAGAMIGWAGALNAYLTRGAYASSLSWENAGDALLMAVLGGMHHFLGALWGAVSFILLEDRLSAITENWWLLFAPILILFVMVAPNGLHGLIARRWTLVRPGIPPRPARIDPFQPAGVQPAGGEVLLQVRGLQKRFGALVVAGGIDLDVRARQLHTVIGPNGAGKSTFFHMLSGVVEPDGGTIRFLGQDITRLPLHQRVRLGLGRSFQIVSVFGHLGTFENVRVAVQATSRARRGFWRDAHGLDAINARTWSLLAAVGLEDQAALPCAELSHGQKRLLEIAITLATDAQLLLLDEPLAGLAERDRVTVTSLITRLARSHAVLLIEHDIDRVFAISDRITVLHQGRLIADGLPAEVASHAEVIAAYLGTGHGNAPAVRREPAPAVPPVPVLEIRGLAAGYGGGQVLTDVDLHVGEGEVVALLGRNGVGKSTLLKAVAGTVAMSSGQLLLDRRPIGALSPFERNRAGIAMVPEGRRLFTNLSVLDNLKLAMRAGGAPLDEVYALFPKLHAIRHRRAEHLSGGERQMVAIGRALMAPSRVILLDEPFEGLAPVVVQEVMEAIHRLRGRKSMVLVEHHAHQVLEVADRAYVLVKGEVAFEGRAEQLADDAELQSSLLGVGAPTEPVSIAEALG